ncbi:MAG: hypothetical protein M1481_04370 [Candidatus Thermoplasmatota archaeon]|jgi:hypothetical protein|nr:hypothetical protein [Candidatus Thermoplasmatota archaeon]
MKENSYKKYLNKDFLKQVAWILIFIGIFVLSFYALQDLGALLGAILIIAIPYGILHWKSLKKLAYIIIVVLVVSALLYGILFSSMLYAAPPAINSSGPFINSTVSPYHSLTPTTFNFTTYMANGNSSAKYAVYINITNTDGSRSFADVMHILHSNKNFTEYYCTIDNLSSGLWLYTLTAEVNYTTSNGTVSHHWITSNGYLQGPLIAPNIYNEYPYVVALSAFSIFLYAGIPVMIILPLIYYFREKKKNRIVKNATNKIIKKDKNENTEKNEFICSNCGAVAQDDDDECWKCHAKFK